MEKIKVMTAEICPITGIWAFDDLGFCTDKFTKGQEMPTVNGGIETFWLVEEQPN